MLLVFAHHRINRWRLPSRVPLWFKIYNAQLKKKHWQLHLCGIQVPLGRPFSSRSSSRIPSKTLDWPSTGCIYITIRYVFTSRLRNECEATCYPGRSHLGPVARALKVAARQIARDVRWKWLIEIGSSVIPCVCNLSLECCLNWIAVVKPRACATATCSPIIPNESIIDLTPRFLPDRW